MVNAMLQTVPLTPAIGAVIEGIDLATPLTNDRVSQLRQALDEHLVLFFDKQSLTPIQQRNFAARFGDLYVHPFYSGHPQAREIMVLAHDATHKANSDRWHNDVTYLEKPARAGILYAEEIPELGGDTLWANMYVAYEALSDPMRAASLEPACGALLCEELHARTLSPRRDGRPPRSDVRSESSSLASRRAYQSCHRPEALFVNQDFTSHIEGLSRKESDALLRFLFEHMAQPEFSGPLALEYRDVAFWDNRWAQHCALADYYPQRRVVRRATIAGEIPV